MKSNFRKKKYIWIMLIVVAVSVVITGIIVASLTKEASAKVESYWFFRESLETGRPITIKNAYFVSSSNGQLVFIHEGNTYQIEGELAEEVSGIADIVIDGETVEKVYKKPDHIEGVLESYTADTLCLAAESDGGVLNELSRNDEVPVYRVNDSKITQLDWNSFIIGISKIDCVMDNGKVCAILLEEDVLPNDIRVVIKNGNEIFYDEIYVKKQSDGSVINGRSLLESQGTNTVEISDGQGLVLCNSSGAAIDSAFEGKFRIMNTESGLVLVNEVPIETYLKYVVPSEMPISFGEEALKCQAVCARTYAYSQIYNQTYAMYGANLDDSTAFQVYHNTGRNDETDKAVEETEGEVITRNGELIVSYYYSTNPQDANSPFYKWTAYLDMSAAKNAEYGALTDIKILEQNEDGYATEIKLIYEDGSKTISNEYTIRKTLGKYVGEIVLSTENVRTDLTVLPSAYFEIIKTEDGGIAIKGAGYGHGIGMSQYGAKALDEAGYTYKEIIEYYYENVLVKEL